MSQAEHLQEHGHPTPRKYVGVAIVLAILTAIEVTISYIDSLRSILVYVLLVLALVKFELVAAWFMHLRFDNAIFKRLFVTGIVTALLVFGVVLTYFFSHGGPAPSLGG
ncbi:MAG: cytochrome c oxidase subunit [Actinomycetota bacterium]|nr:cytochrome c oxidase subunit [Actinomycetota bacterium]